MAENDEIIKCPFCAGTGQVSKNGETAKNKICQDCNGSGRCYPCGGTGGFGCVFCEGIGKNSNEEPCEGCNGTGEIECQNCDGSGDCPDCEDGTEKLSEMDSISQNLINDGIKLITIIDSNIQMYKNTNEFPVRVVFYWYNKSFDNRKKKWHVNAGEITEDFGKKNIKVITFPINQKVKIKNVIRL